MTQDGAAQLMDAFAVRTGLRSDAAPQRYLWTDAFAVVNWLELYRQTQERRFRALATGLIGQVHATLARHRADDPRSGWLSGLSDGEGEAHPTIGGLRIGKPLPERRSAEPPDEQLEWHRDGQYFHYLTKWMDALARAGSLLGESRYLTWAAELARAVLPRFLRRSPAGEPLGLAWKMSVDLERAQVAGFSPHDALDGYVTFRWIVAAGGEPALEDDIRRLRRLVQAHRWGTADPLGLGGLLLDAARLTLLPAREGDDGLNEAILSGVSGGLGAFVREGSLERPADRRLGFRELGLAIGLQGLDAIGRSPAGPRWRDALEPARSLGERIVGFWFDPRNRQGPTWQDHRDINDVMLATALLQAQAGTAILAEPVG